MMKNKQEITEEEYYDQYWRSTPEYWSEITDTHLVEHIDSAGCHSIKSVEVSGDTEK